MRTLSKLGLLLAMLGVLLGLAAPASAQTASAGQASCKADEDTKTGSGSKADEDPGRVDIIKAQGLVDPVLADFIDESISAGERRGVIAVVIQLDSSGSVVSPARLTRLARHIRNARVPVTVWVGPSGSRATGGAAQLAGAAELVGLAPGARLGKTGDLDIPASLLQPKFRAALDRLSDSTVNDKEARSKELGITPNREAAVIGQFIIDLDGVKTCEVKQGGRTVREPVSLPVFSQLPVQDQLFHTVASPPAAYLLFVIGLSLIVFELFTAGVGVAGLVGAGCFVLSCYGLAVLPTRPIGIALLVLAIFGFTVDVQTGVPRVWSGIGAAALLAGSLTLYDGLSISWIALLVGIVGTSLFMIAGMPAMVRTRFSTPTIGREWMIGEEGEAVTNVSPDGVVRVRGALWRARTNRATPIDLHGSVRVVEVDGLLLEVEPLEGGAIDYREKRRGGDGAGEGDDDVTSDADVVLVDGRPLDR